MVGRNNYFLGIDGGGSKCRATLYSREYKVLGTGCAGSANVARGTQSAIESIVEASIQAVESAGLAANELSQIVVGAGLAGTGVSSAKKQLSQWRSPFKAFYFTSDLHTACLGAHQGNDGAVLIVGTGSCAANIIDNKLTQFGGHGFVLGDKGSGAWLGRQAIQLTLEQIDGIGTVGNFATTILQHLSAKTPSDVIEKMNHAKPKEFATLAPVVLQLAQQHNQDAVNIVTQGAAYLSHLCSHVLQHNNLTLARIGGLASSIEPWLDDKVQQRFSPAQQTPEWGAVYFAKQQMALAAV